MSLNVCSIRVHPIDRRAKTYLSLQGSILTITYRRWDSTVIKDVPVELLSIDRKQRYNGRRLAYAILFLLLCPSFGAMVMMVTNIVYGDVAPRLIAISLGGGAFIGLIAFLIQFLRFLVRVPIIILRVVLKPEVAFWIPKGSEAELEVMLEEICKRTPDAEEISMQSVLPPMEMSHIDPQRRLFTNILLCTIPCIFTGIPWLLLLCLVPPVLQWRAIWTHMRRPKLFRRALSRYRKGQFQQALEALEELLAQQPDNLDGRSSAITAFMPLSLLA